MSLSQSVSKAIDNIIHTYIQQISEKYNLEPSELLQLWDGKSVNVPKDVKSTSVVSQDLSKMGKPELIALCKQKGIKCTGTKNELIERLGNPPENKTIPIAPKKTDKTIPPVVKSLTANIPKVAILRNKFGNYEHAETSFVFNGKSQKVIGKQNENGEIDELTPEDIDICNKFKFEFEIPENLDKKTNLADVTVEELDEEEVLLEEEMEEDEEEEEEFEEEYEEEYEE